MGKSFEYFLSELSIQECKQDDSIRGCTWIELYILYRLRGGIKMVKEPASSLTKKASADKRIKCFRNTVRAIVERTLAQADKDLFKPGTLVNDSLRGVGLLGKSANVCFNVQVTGQEQQAIAVAISSLNRTAPLKTHKDYVNGACQLKPKRLKLNGKSGWDFTLACLTPKGDEESWWAKTYAERYVGPATETMFHHCPECRREMSTRHGKFQRLNLDAKIRCGFCLKQSACRAWKCHCGEHWHCCEIHKRGYTSNVKQSMLSKPRAELPDNHNQLKGVKRQLESSFRVRSAKRFKSQSQGVKRTGIVLSGPMSKTFKRPSTLGPILSARFDHNG